MFDASTTPNRLEQTHRQCCDLCDFPLGRARFEKQFEGKRLAFCCAGCMHVYQILASRPDAAAVEFRDTDVYRSFLEAGLIRQGESGSPAGVAGRPPEPDLPEWEADLAEEATWKVEGMWCTACGWAVETVLRQVPGIVRAEVCFVTDSARFTYLPHRLDTDAMRSRIADLGYSLDPFTAAGPSSRIKKDLLIRFGVSAILTMNIMMLSFALYSGFFGWIEAGAVRYFSYPIWLMATAVVFYGGFPILRSAGKNLRFGGMTMDVLIGIGTLSAYVYSTVHVPGGGIHLYFDTAAMLITLVLLGRLIETHIRHRITAGIETLQRLARQKVRLRRDGRERWTHPETVAAGERFQVNEGERVPLDGRIVNGNARVDESLLTGESRPISKTTGAEVRAGSLVVEGTIGLDAVRTVAESTVGRMVALVQEALLRKNPAEDLADRITRRLVPGILLLSAGTAVFWHLRGASIDQSVLRAITVLVVTCPCALGIAVPLTKVAAIACGRSFGVLIRSQEALETVKDLDVLVMDKTGTVTEGRYALRHIHAAAGEDSAGVLERLAAVEAHSGHYLAREVVRRAAAEGRSVRKAQNFRAFEGRGVCGDYRGVKIAAGNRPFVEDQTQAPAPPELAASARGYETCGMTTVYFGWQGCVRGVLVFGDRIRPTSREAVEKIKARGLEVRLLSGDSVATTRAVAWELGIENYAGGMLPADKAEVVRGLQAQGRRVAMVGDGVNDAPAFAAADLGFAMGARADVLQSVSDLTLLSSDPAAIDRIFRLSGLASRVLRQNLFFAFFYNLIGVPLAVAGLLNPLVAVIAMFASSLTVVGNTLRVVRLANASPRPQDLPENAAARHSVQPRGEPW